MIKHFVNEQVENIHPDLLKTRHNGFYPEISCIKEIKQEHFNGEIPNGEIPNGEIPNDNFVDENISEQSNMTNMIISFTINTFSSAILEIGQNLGIIRKYEIFSDKSNKEKP